MQAMVGGYAPSVPWSRWDQRRPTCQSLSNLLPKSRRWCATASVWT